MAHPAHWVKTPALDSLPSLLIQSQDLYKFSKSVNWFSGKNSTAIFFQSNVVYLLMKRECPPELSFFLLFFGEASPMALSPVSKETVFLFLLFLGLTFLFIPFIYNYLTN